MSNINTHELLRFSSPTMLVVGDINEEENLDILPVKGFASVERDDRSGDLTSPNEFNIPEFMAAPTLLLNHKFWTDFSGNQVSIGRVMGMWVATLRKNEDDDTVWNIRDEKTKDIITTMPKVKMPSLKKGDRGLFIKAEVTVRAVIEMIQRGELGAVSWRGLVVVEWEVDPETHLTRRVLKDIDIFEVSLVHVPDMNQSTFLVGKDGMSKPIEYDFTNVQVWRMELPKSKFLTEKMAEGYLEGHKTLSSNITHSDTVSWYADQQPSDRFDLSKTVRVPMGDSFTLLAPLVVDSVKETESDLVGELLDLTKTDAIAIGDTVMAADSKTAAEDSAVKTDDKLEVSKASDENKGTTVKDKAKSSDDSGGKISEKKEKSKEAQLTELSDAVGVSVANALKPTLEGIATGMTGLGDTMKTIAEKMAAGVEASALDTDDTTEKDKLVTDTEKKAVEKSADLGSLMDVLNTLVSSLDETQKQVVEIAKTAIDMGKHIPNETEPRDEKIKSKGKEDVEKSAEDEDLNACFSDIMPFGS